MSLLSLRTAQLFSSLQADVRNGHIMTLFFWCSEVKRFVLGEDFGRRHSEAVRLYWPGFCTDSFFLWVDGVDFLYRRRHFMHAGLCVVCFGFGVCWVLTFAAAMLFSSSAVTWLVGCVGHVLTKQCHLWYSVTFGLSCLSQRLQKLFTVRRM